MDMPDYTRLHITPLTPSLLTTYLPASMQANARNISYHVIQTFPEKSYGYVELPQGDAERLIKKLHGCIVKNLKVRIENARPVRPGVSVNTESALSSVPLTTLETMPATKILLPSRLALSKNRSGPRNKMTRDVPGVDIGERHVKRGWTIPLHESKKKRDPTQTSMPHKKSAVKSKFTLRSECLFKTRLPANRLIDIPEANKVTKSKRKGKPKEIIIHEFSNTTKYATFLKSSNFDHCNISGNDNCSTTAKDSSNAMVARYVGGKGWFDEQNNLIEKVFLRRSKCSKKSIRDSDKDEGRRKIAPDLVDTRVGLEKEKVDDNNKCSQNESYHRISHVEPNKKGLDNINFNSKIPSNGLNSKDITCENSKMTSCSTFFTYSVSSCSSPSLPSESGDSRAESVDTALRLSERRESKNISSFRDTDTSCCSSSISISRTLPPNGSSANCVEEGRMNDDNDKELEIQKCKMPSSISTTSEISSVMNSSPNIKTSAKTLQKSNLMHPLASLYKKSESSEPKSMFKFFADESEKNSDHSDQIHSLQTPLARQDILSRHIRSSAPTPDTAHNHMRFGWRPKIKGSIGSQDEDQYKSNNNLGQHTLGSQQVSNEIINMRNDNFKNFTARNISLSSSDFIDASPVATKTRGFGREDQEKQSDFQKWFWINQGQINRGWKKRRKLVMKEQRQKDSSKKNLK